MQITTCSDASGRSVTFSDKKFLATSFAGLLPIAHIARSLGLFKNAKEVISAAVPCKCNTLYSPQAMFEQRVLALAAGFEDLNDHDQLNETLLTTFAQANNKLGLLPKIRRKGYRCIFLDVDSTYVELYGNQEKKSYNGHY